MNEIDHRPVDLRRFDLNLLVALDALLRHRNVTRAGEQLHLTQSAMSGELRRLRQMFGDELLIREGREYELSPLARELVDPVGEILARIQRTIDHRTAFDPAAEARTFSVVMSDYAMLLLLQPLLRRTGKEAPGVSVSVSPFRDHRIPRMLRHGDVDLVIGPEFDLEGVNSQALFSDRFVCIVSSDHPDVGDHVTRELFDTLPRLSVQQHPMLRGIAEAQLSSEEWSAEELASILGPGNADVLTESFVLTPFLVSGTRLVALVPERLAHQFRDSAGVKVLDPPAPVPELQETMYWSAVADTDPAHAWLRQTISEVAQTIM